MRFEEIIGNDELKRLLPQMVREGRLPHAVLFTEEGRAFFQVRPIEAKLFVDGLIVLQRIAAAIHRDQVD